MKVLRYTPERLHAWNDFVRTARNGHFMFERGYMDYHADRFEDFSLMIYEEDGSLLSLLPANIKDGVCHSHQGLTFGGFLSGRKMRAENMLEASTAAAAFLKEQGVKQLVYKAIPHFYHQQPAQEDIYALFRLGATCHRVDISSTIDFKSRRYAFSASRKSGLKKVREAGVTVDTGNDFAAFFAIVTDLLEEKYGARATHTAEEMALLHSRFPNNIRLHAAYEDGKMIAGIIIYETPLVAHTQYIAASPRGKEIGALDLLFEQLINETYAGKNYFDFGISTEKDGTYLNANLISQKEGTGARGTVHQFFTLDLDKVFY